MDQQLVPTNFAFDGDQQLAFNFNFEDSAEPDGTKLARSKQVNDATWEFHREEILLIYKKAGYSLEDTSRLMAQKQLFFATYVFNL